MKRNKVTECELCGKAITDNMPDRAGVAITVAAKGNVTMSNFALCIDCFDKKVTPYLKQLHIELNMLCPACGVTEEVMQNATHK